MPCHGKGNLATDGCCWVNGEPCPLRLKIVDGRVLEGVNSTDVGTLAQWVQRTYPGNKRSAATDQLTAVTYACRAAVDVITADTGRLDNRAAFEAAWNNHADYVALVRPAWDAIEDSLGLARGSYQCSTWRGVNTPECCFAEPLSQVNVKIAPLTANAKKIRQAAG